MTIDRRAWMRRALLGTAGVVVAQQVWRHGRDYVFADQFAVVEPGKLYRGAWQQPWPMRRLISGYKFKTVVALAHPADHPLSVREKAICEELGVRWVHIPIVDERRSNDYRVINEKLSQAAAVLADPANRPLYFHCHHGLNRASMVQIAYRTKYCGWTLERANAEISETFGLKLANHGPDYRHMESYYNECVLPDRAATAAAEARPTY